MARWVWLLIPLVCGCVAFRPHVAPEPDEPIDHLALAADALDRGDERTASLRFAAHLHDFPDDAATLFQLAELLFKQDRTTEAYREFEAFVSVAQPATGPVRKLLPHAHTRLMQLAQESDDAAAEQLHRGIGLVVLAMQWDAAPDRADDGLEHRTLMKAVRALRAARGAHPARANLYLALAYDRLGQLSAVRSALRNAEAANPFALTPWERDRLAALGSQ